MISASERKVDSVPATVADALCAGMMTLTAVNS